MKYVFALFILSISVNTYAQNYSKRDINKVIKKANNALNKINSLHYNFKLLDKSFGDTDTLIINGQCKMVNLNYNNLENIQFYLEYDRLHPNDGKSSNIDIFDGTNLFIRYTTDTGGTKTSISNEKQNNYNSINGNKRRSLLFNNIIPKNSLKDYTSLIGRMLVKNKSMIDTTLNNRACYRVEFTLKNLKGDNMTQNNKRYFYIDKATSLPIKIQSYSEFENMVAYDDYDIEYVSINTEMDKNIFQTAQYINASTEVKNNYEVKNIVNTVDTYAVLYDHPIILTNGDSLYLRDLKGKVIVLDFWYKSCLPCLKLMPELDKVSNKYKESEVVILGINDRDDREAIIEYFQFKNYTYPTSFKNNFHFSDNLNIQEFPRTIIIDKNGKIAYQHMGFDKKYFQTIDNFLEKLIAE